MVEGVGNSAATIRVWCRPDNHEHAVYFETVHPLRCQSGFEGAGAGLRYSSRRASVGLTFDARHAGISAAARAPAARTSAAAAIVAGSVALTPNNWDLTSLPRAAMQGRARAIPN